MKPSFRIRITGCCPGFVGNIFWKIGFAFSDWKCSWGTFPFLCLLLWKCAPTELFARDFFCLLFWASWIACLVAGFGAAKRSRSDCLRTGYCSFLHCNIIFFSTFVTRMVSPSSTMSLQVLDRGEKIELLVDKTENLQFQVCTRHIFNFCDSDFWF